MKEFENRLNNDREKNVALGIQFEKAVNLEESIISLTNATNIDRDNLGTYMGGVF